MTVRNLFIDPLTGDLVITKGVLQLASDSDAITQAVIQALRTIAGEYFLDATVGVPYFEQVLVKRPDPDLLKKVFTDAILAVRGVTSVVQLDLSYNPPLRALTITFQARGDNGQLFSGQTSV